MITAYLTHPHCVLHHMGPEHPESPERLEAIRARLSLSGLLQQTMQGMPRKRMMRRLHECTPYAT